MTLLVSETDVKWTSNTSMPRRCSSAPYADGSRGQSANQHLCLASSPPCNMASTP